MLQYLRTSLLRSRTEAMGRVSPPRQFNRSAWMALSSFSDAADLLCMHRIFRLCADEFCAGLHQRSLIIAAHSAEDFGKLLQGQRDLQRFGPGVALLKLQRCSVFCSGFFVVSFCGENTREPEFVRRNSFVVGPEGLQSSSECPAKGAFGIVKLPLLVIRNRKVIQDNRRFWMVLPVETLGNMQSPYM